MKKIIFIILIIPITIFVARQIYRSIDPGQTTKEDNVVINKKVIKVEIADDMIKQIQGLSDRPALADGEGMLFIFAQKQARRFWMKNMKFSLDIIWIDDNKIVKIDANLPPEGAHPQKSYDSIWPINYVLEVKAGYTEKNNIKVGDKVKYNIK
jgi:uncharacterized membrane protein (UPF0127 family)